MANKELFELPELESHELSGGMGFYLVDPVNGSRYVTLEELKTFVNTDPTVVPSSEPFRGALVYRTETMAISGFQNVSWQAAEYDTDSIWSAGAPTRLTVPAGVAKVRLSGYAPYTSGATDRRAAIVPNGEVSAEGFTGEMRMNSSSVPVRMSVISAVIPVTAGEYFELRVGSGGILDVQGWFAMEIIEASI